MIGTPLVCGTIQSDTIQSGTIQSDTRQSDTIQSGKLNCTLPAADEKEEATDWWLDQ